MDSRVAYEAVLDSDRAYFAAGAESIALPGGAIFHMPDFPDITAAGCGHLLDNAGSERDAEGWITRLVEGFASLGRDYARVYLSRPSPRLASALIARGFVANRETAFAAAPLGGFSPPSTSAFALHRITTESDWADKLALHLRAKTSPDGKSGQPADWTAFERRKTEAGYMQPFLILRDGRPVATFSIAVLRDMLRVKNVVVDPGFRNQGAASAAIGFCCALAEEVKLQSIGLLALTGGAGERLYTSRGMSVVGYLDEYYLARDPSAPPAASG